MNEETIDKANNDYIKKFKTSPVFFELTDEQHREEWFINRLIEAVELDDNKIFIADKIDLTVNY